MGFRRHITFQPRLTAACRAASLIAALSAVVTLSGCASFCALDGKQSVDANAVAQAGKTPSQSHRPPMGLPEETSDETQISVPQTVNVFGEVNGVKTRTNLISSGSAFQQHTFADEGFDTDVAIDPTGKWMVFASTRNSEHPSLYLQRVDGSAVTQLTDGGSDEAYPAFSPDGKQIAFSSTRAGNWQLFTMDLDGRNIVQLTSGIMQCIHPSFSPDGTRVAYCSLGRSGQWELWTLDLKTNEKKMVGYGLFPTWSPNKMVDRIAFQRARQRGSRWFSLWTMDLVEGEGRRATEVAVSANAAILSPCWSPDGKHLAFATVIQPGKGGESRPRGQTDIWTIDAEGANRQRLTDGRANNLMPYWSSDGRIYFLSDRGGAESVWSIRLEAAKAITVDSAGAKKEKTAVGTADASEDAPR